MSRPVATKRPPLPRTTRAASELPARWSSVAEVVPGIRCHPLGSRTWVLRQALRTHFEAPFMYLLQGDHRALLIDSGAGGVNVRQAVTALIGDQPLWVVNTHPHSDHIQGNASLAERPATRVWTGCLPEVLDLGARLVSTIPTPGHHPDHRAFYDAEEGLLLTGDFLYAGRLYISDFAAYQASLDALAAVAMARPVRWILGSHIEMSARRGVEFAEGAIEHPDEGHLELTCEILPALRDQIAAQQQDRRRLVCDRYVIVPV